MEPMRPNKFVYVIYGHHDLLRRELFPFLRKLSLDPLDKNDLRLANEASSLLSQVIANGLKMAQAILIVHLTNDEQETDTPEITEARSSFKSEVALASNTPEKVLHLQFGRVSEDLHHYEQNRLYLDNSVPTRERFIRQLRERGCPVSQQQKWFCTGDFSIETD